jgi:hypothetical protein
MTRRYERSPAESKLGSVARIILRLRYFRSIIFVFDDRITRWASLKKSNTL